LTTALRGDTDTTILTHAIIVRTAHFSLETGETEAFALTADAIATAGLPFAEAFHLGAVFTRELPSAMTATKEADSIASAVV
jgi:hypothetical protein